MCQACQNPPGYLYTLRAIAEVDAKVAAGEWWHRRPTFRPDAPHVKDVRAACRNASRKLQPDYLGPLTLAQCASRLGRHEGLTAEDRETVQETVAA